MNKQTQNKILLFLNIAGFLGTIIVNSLANILPINNRTTGQLSDQYRNLFVPAGITFSIWGLIYLLLAVFIIFHIIGTIKKKEEWISPYEKIGVFFFLLSLFNMSWIFVWHYELISLSMIIMLLLLWSLLVIYLRLAIGKSDASLKEKLLVFMPVSIYLGWITVATIANATTLLVSIQWDGFGFSEQFWTITVIITALAIGLVMLFQKKDIFFNLVIIWAFTGIIIKRMAAVFLIQDIINTAATCAIVIAVCIIIQLFRKKIY